MIAHWFTNLYGTAAQFHDVICWAGTCLEKGVSGGGLILSFGGGVAPDTPPDNIDALVQVVHDWSGAQEYIGCGLPIWAIMYSAKAIGVKASFQN